VFTTEKEGEGISRISPPVSFMIGAVNMQKKNKCSKKKKIYSYSEHFEKELSHIFDMISLVSNVVSNDKVVTMNVLYLISTRQGQNIASFAFSCRVNFRPRPQPTTTEIAELETNIHIYTNTHHFVNLKFRAPPFVKMKHKINIR